MDAWFELLLREVVALCVLGAVGLGLTSFLGPAVDRTSRLALAPAFGVAATTCVLATTVWLIPAGDGWPFLVALVIGGSALAWYRSRKLPRDDPSAAPLRLDRRSLVMVGIIAVVILGTFTAPVAVRDSTGPVGTYVIDAAWDQPQIDTLADHSIRSASDLHGPWSDLTHEFSAGLITGFQQIGWDSVVAHFDGLLGLHAADTQTALLIVLILVGALGIFGSVRVVTRSQSWFLLLGPLLVAGPFFRQLFYDGSQAAISGLVLVVPLALLGWLALRDRRREDLVLFAVLAAGLMTLYPLHTPAVALAGVVVLAIVVTRVWRSEGAASGRRLVFGAMGAVALVALLSPVALERNIRFWKSILTGDFDFSGYATYGLPLDVFPGWLFQTREFHDLNQFGPTPIGDLSALGVVGGLVIPIFLLGVVVYALRRKPVLLGLLLIVAAAVIFALRTSTHNNCSYCTGRNTLIIAPILMALLGVGVVLLAGLRTNAGRIAAGVVTVICVGLVGFRGYQSADRTTVEGFSLSQDVEQVLKSAPDDGPTHLEGFGLSVHATAEAAFTYNRINESLDSPLSIAAEAQNGGLLYLGGPRQVGPEFRSDYRYVLTRIASVQTPRKTLSRSGPFALEERTSDLDATVAAGALIEPAWKDPSGAAWLAPNYPLVIWVVGSSDPAFVEMRLDATVPVQTASSDMPANVMPEQGGYRVCAEVPPGPAPRRVSLVVGFVPISPVPPKPPWVYVGPQKGVRLATLSASRKNCGVTDR